MAAIVWTDITGFAAALSVVPTGTQDTILAYVNAELDDSLYGGEDSPKLKIARIYLAAHFATMGGYGATSSAGGSAGPVSSKSVSADSISISYASLSRSIDSSSLQLTPWGQMYDDLTPLGARLPMVV